MTNRPYVAFNISVIEYLPFVDIQLARLGIYSVFIEIQLRNNDLLYMFLNQCGLVLLFCRIRSLNSRNRQCNGQKKNNNTKQENNDPQNITL